MSPHIDVHIATPDGAYTNQVESPTHIDDQWLLRDSMLEMVGTGFFVYIALSGVHQAIYSAMGGGAVSDVHVALCFMLGLSAGIMVAGKSGGHLNPAVSFTLFLAGNISFVKFVSYMVCQTVGAFLGALLVIALNYSHIMSYPDHSMFIGAMGTLKNPNNSLFSSILDQILGSALLMLGILKSTDTKWKPLFIGLVLGGLGLMEGQNSFAFNFARDMGPRIASSIIYGSDPFTLQDNWWIIPAIFSFVGAPIGLLISWII